MAFYLVEGTPKDERLDELKEKLATEAFGDLRPFGPTITNSLRNARRRPNGWVVWEEEDYCSPPLAQERDAVLDRYFHSMEVERVAEDEGWAQLRALAPLFRPSRMSRAAKFLRAMEALASAFKKRHS